MSLFRLVRADLLLVACVCLRQVKLTVEVPAADLLQQAGSSNASGAGTDGAAVTLFVVAMLTSASQASPKGTFRLSLLTDKPAALKLRS